MRTLKTLALVLLAGLASSQSASAATSVSAEPVATAAQTAYLTCEAESAPLATTLGSAVADAMLGDVKKCYITYWETDEMGRIIGMVTVEVPCNS